MKPIDQTTFAPRQYEKERKTFGNCVQACLASIFEKDINEVPHCVYMNGGTHVKWLKEIGYAMYETSINIQFDGYHLITGISPRTILGADGITEFPLFHCVVAKNGEIVHDPHPSRAGISVREKHYWFIKLDPAH